MNIDLHLACTGDRAAAARVYDATCASAWRLAMAIHGGDAGRAEALMLDAYRHAFATHPDTPASPLTWVLTHVRSTARRQRAAA